MTASVPSIPLPSVVVPDPRRYEALHGVIKQSYAHWRHEYLLAHPQPPIRNVRFEHQIDWRDNWLSIQNAHDLKAPVWKAAFGMMTVAQFGPAWIVIL